MQSYLLAALGFFAGLSTGLGIAVALCVWWVRTVHRSMFDDPTMSLDQDDLPSSSDATVVEEEPEEWWKRN